MNTYYKFGSQAALATFVLLEKNAASVDELHAALRRARPPVRLPRPISGDFGIIGNGPEYIQPAKKIEKQLHPEVRSHPVMRQELERLRQKLPAPVQGRVVTGPGGGVRAVPEALQTIPGAAPPPRLSGPGARATNVALMVHELAESRVPTHISARTSGNHGSIDVLAQERNMMRRLTGPGADEARQFFRHTRDVTGENADFDAFLRKKFGPRAVAVYGTEGSSKIPRSLRKRLALEWRQHNERQMLEQLREQFPTPAR